MWRWNRANINVASTKRLTHAADHTIRGTGAIHGGIENSGRIEGDGPTESMAIHFHGLLSGDGPISNVIIHGTHSPGFSPAIVPLEGRYGLVGQLDIDIGGPNPGTGHDQLLSTGTIDLGTGTIDIHLINGYVPPIGSEFLFLDAAGGITGNPVVNVPMVNGEPIFEVSFGATFGQLLTVLEVPEPLTPGLEWIGGAGALSAPPEAKVTAPALQKRFLVRTAV